MSYTENMFFFSLNVTFLLAVWWLVLRWYIRPRLRALPFHQALIPILLLHMTRANGAIFVIQGLVSPQLARAMAEPAAYGDLLTALLALLALVALHRKWRWAIPLVWLFNLIGLADLLNVLRMVVLYNVDPAQLGVMYLIVVLVVPGLLLTHFEVFGLLRGGGRR